jgi:hypothetical protein
MGQDNEYLYGQLLQCVNKEFEEPILLFLEMLKIFFPAGLQVQTTDTHKQF